MGATKGPRTRQLTTIGALLRYSEPKLKTQPAGFHRPLGNAIFGLLISTHKSGVCIPTA